MHILLPSLTDLTIWGYPHVEMFPDGGLPPNLKRVNLLSSKLIASLKGALGDNASLENLGIFKDWMWSLFPMKIFFHSPLILYK